VDIILEPPDDIIPNPETNLPFVAPVVIPRGTLFVLWHDSPTLNGRFSKGSPAPLMDLNVFGNLIEYHIREPNRYFSVFRDGRIGEFRGRYFAFRYGRPRLPDVGSGNEYTQPHFVGPVDATQYAVIYAGKIYRDNYEGDRKIYSLKGTKWKQRRDGSRGYDTIYVSGKGFSTLDFDAGKIYKDVGIYSFVYVRIMNSGLNTRQRQWEWYIWVLIGKVDIVVGIEEKRFCLMNFTADTSERIGEINHPWHIKPPSKFLFTQLGSPEDLGVDFEFKHLYKQN
jgi:hypothetical protein